jgi:hypothetical protein
MDKKNEAPGRPGSNAIATVKVVNKKDTRKKSEDLKRFEREYTDWHYAQHPLIPEKARVKRKFDDRTANGLTKAIIFFLRMKGHQAERINTMGHPIDTRRTVTDVVGITRRVGSITWVKSSSTRGSADISATINGRSVKIEVKVGKDKQSQAQKEYQRTVEQAGGLYVIAKDFESFVEWYYKLTKREPDAKRTIAYRDNTIHHK